MTEEAWYCCSTVTADRFDMGRVAFAEGSLNDALQEPESKRAKLGNGPGHVSSGYLISGPAKPAAALEAVPEGPSHIIVSGLPTYLTQEKACSLSLLAELPAEN